MAKDSSGSAPISDESKGYLEEVKKGKPRKFAMICKGTSVISLVVYKKGNVEKRKKEAKESGKGQFYFGVVDGKGMDLRFVLARSDGFESEPVKATVLKGFLDESAGLKCKPRFEIVDVTPLTLDEDDPLVARFLQLQESAVAACDNHPDRAVEINTLCRQIGSYLDQDQSDQAKEKLESLESLLQSLGSRSTPTSPDSDNNNDALIGKLVEALKQLKPLLEQVVTQHADRKAELIASFAQIRDEIKSQKLTEAQENLTSLEQLLQSLAATSRTPSSEPDKSGDEKMALWKAKVAELGPAIKAAIAAKGPNTADMVKLLTQANALSKPGGNIDEAIAKLTECHGLISQGSNADPAALFNERLKAILPDVKAAAGTPTGEEAKLRASEAGMFARKKDFAQANQLLDRVIELLKSSGADLSASDSSTQSEQPKQSSTPEITAGVVKYRTALLNYRSERQKVLSQLEELYKAVVAALPERAEMTRELRERLEATFEEIDDAIDDAINAAQNEREPYNDSTRALIKTFAKSLTSDKIIAQVDTNPFVKISVASTLVSALDNIQKTMV